MNMDNVAITEEEFFNSFMGIDELEVPYSKTNIQLLEFDVNRRNYKEVDRIDSIQLIVHGGRTQSHTKLEITFQPKLRSDIKKMKGFIKRVEDSRANMSMTKKPDILNVTLFPTRPELSGSRIFSSNPGHIEIEENGFLFNKNLTAHLLFPNANVLMEVSFQEVPEESPNINIKTPTNTPSGDNKRTLFGGNNNEEDKNSNIVGGGMGGSNTKDPEDKVKEPVNERAKEEMMEDELSFNALEGSEDPEGELNKLIGLDNVKEKIDQMRKRMAFEQKKKEAGIGESRASNRHMIFYGEPGTGKTTVARIVTGILYDMGLVRKNKCIEVNGEMLKGKYMGASAPKTQRMVNRAMGGVLFIDEAYTIMDNFSSGGGYGKEVVSVLLKAMEDHKDDLIIIFAGYEKEMEEFLETNPGLKSRIGDKIEFVSYQPEDLEEIFCLMLQGHGLNITREAHLELFNRLFDVYNLGMTSGDNGNARYVENLVEKIVDLHAYSAVNLEEDDPMLFVIQKETIEDYFKDIPRTLDEEDYQSIGDLDPMELVFNWG